VIQWRADAISIARARYWVGATLVYRSVVISSIVSRTSALVLLLGGLALLFASDTLLPMLAPGFPRNAAWLGQLIGAAWLGVAALNWLQRTVLIGGIYGRPIVLANFVLYFISALSLLRALPRASASPMAWAIVAPAAVLAIVYGALLMRGPFDALQAVPAKKPQART
jgi:hypothetical protein